MRKTLITAIAAALLVTGAAGTAQSYDGHWHGHGGYHGGHYYHSGYYHGGYWHGGGYWHQPVVVGAYAPAPYPYPYAPVAYPVAPVGLSLGFSLR